MQKLHVALVGLVCILAYKTETANALYTRKGPVSLLTPKTFDKVIHQSNLPAVVEFYAPWYGNSSRWSVHVVAKLECWWSDLAGVATANPCRRHIKRWQKTYRYATLQNNLMITLLEISRVGATA